MAREDTPGSKHEAESDSTFMHHHAKFRDAKFPLVVSSVSVGMLSSVRSLFSSPIRFFVLCSVTSNSRIADVFLLPYIAIRTFSTDWVVRYSMDLLSSLLLSSDF